MHVLFFGCRGLCGQYVIIAFHYFHSWFSHPSGMWPIHVQVISHMCTVKMIRTSEELHLGNFYLYTRSLFHLLVQSLKPLYLSQQTEVSIECLLLHRLCCEYDVIKVMESMNEATHLLSLLVLGRNTHAAPETGLMTYLMALITFEFLFTTYGHKEQLNVAKCRINVQ